MIFDFKTEEAALIIVDMQEGFLNEGAAMEVGSGRAIIPNIQRLINCCRNADVPVIYTRFVYSPQVPNLIGELHTQHKPPTCCCMLGDQSVEIVPALQPVANDLVVDKHGYDAFHNTNLDYALRSLKRRQLIVTGVMTDICVLATVTSALHHEYQVWVVSDGTATLWDNVQETTLDLCSRAYGTVETTDIIITWLTE
jgi:ureidoacrylate peracid hydrolase